MSATSPAVMGVAIEVPAMPTMGQSPAELELAESKEKPGATRSGLKRPPTAGPCGEKERHFVWGGRGRGRGGDARCEVRGER